MVTENGTQSFSLHSLDNVAKTRTPMCNSRLGACWMSSRVDRAVEKISKAIVIVLLM